MDIEQLKSEVRKYINAMKKDGKEFSFFALIPTYPGLESTPYIIQVKADWIDKMSFKAVLDYMIPKMYEVTEQETRRYIDRISIFKEKGDTFCMSKRLILINKIKYSPEEYYWTMAS